MQGLAFDNHLRGWPIEHGPAKDLVHLDSASGEHVVQQLWYNNRRIKVYVPLCFLPPLIQTEP
jgi:hypothetical protein